MWTVLLTGLVLGLEHAFEPDHLAAVSVFASDSKDLSAVAKMGMVWGMGHTMTLVIIGGSALLFNVTIPDNLASFLELMVGFLLLALGIRVFVRLYRERIHQHVHAHGDGSTHVHLHLHGETSAHSHDHRSIRQTFLVGLLHGGAGSAAAVLLIVTMVDNPLQDLLLIFLFGVGSIGGMMIVSILLGLTTRFMDRMAGWQRVLNVTAGAFSVVFGMLIVNQFLLGM